MSDDPAGISDERRTPGLRETAGAAFQWTTHVLPLKARYPQYAPALTKVLKKKYAPCI